MTLFRLLEHHLKFGGVKAALTFIKKARVEFLLLLAASPGTPQRRLQTLRVRNFLGESVARVALKATHAKPESLDSVRVVLTALTLLRSFHLPVKVDLSTITADSQRVDTGSWKDSLSPFWKEMKERFRMPGRRSSY